MSCKPAVSYVRQVRNDGFLCGSSRLSELLRKSAPMNMRRNKTLEGIKWRMGREEKKAASKRQKPTISDPSGLL